MTDEHIPLAVVVTNNLLGEGKDVWLDITGDYAGNSLMQWTHRGDIFSIDCHAVTEAEKRIIKGDYAVGIVFNWQHSDGGYRRKSISVEASTFDDEYTLKKDGDAWLLTNHEPLKEAEDTGEHLLILLINDILNDPKKKLMWQGAWDKFEITGLSPIVVDRPAEGVWGTKRFKPKYSGKAFTIRIKGSVGGSLITPDDYDDFIIKKIDDNTFELVKDYK